MTPWSRRRFLTGLGAAALAAPFARLLTGEARAATAGPRRLMVMFTPNGTVPNRLWPSGGETDFAFGAGHILEPLEPVRDRITLLKGLQFFGATNHEGGMASMLTNGGGATTETQGRSLDQVVADAIGTGTRFKSMEFGVQTSAWGGNVQTRMSYSGAGTYITPDDNPLNAYSRMFGDLLGGEDAAARLRARRTAVLDTTRSELIDLHMRLGAAERIKLEAHLESLAAMEQGLSEGTTCAPGDSPAVGGGTYDNDSFPIIGRSQTDLAVSALACGMTNVASLQWGHTITPVVMSWLGLTEGHHSLSHIDDSNQAGIADYVTAERWFAEQFAYLLDSLAAQPDPEGDGTLLDSTLVVWAQELGDGRAHVCTDVPWILAGATDCLPGGRFLDLGPTNHAHVLTSICQAFGLPNQTFGDPAAGSGPVSGLFT